jgi:hypothetical protein
VIASPSLWGLQKTPHPAPHVLEEAPEVQLGFKHLPSSLYPHSQPPLTALLCRPSAVHMTAGTDAPLCG